MFGAITTEFKDLGSAFLQSLLWMVSGKMTLDPSDETLDSGTKDAFFIILTVRRGVFVFNHFERLLVS